MDSNQLIKALKQAFEKACSDSLDIDMFPVIAQDVAFEIVSTETALAGLASQLLDGERPDPGQLAVCQHIFLRDTVWYSRDGRTFDLRSHDDLLDKALKLLDLRNLITLCSGPRR